MVNAKVIVITALLVIGAYLFATTRGGGKGRKSCRKKGEFVSKEEISLTAEVIIGELDAEAAEALPSDLKPNTEALSLTEDEETEFFAILNSVGDCCASSPLGASVPKVKVAHTTVVDKNDEHYLLQKLRAQRKYIVQGIRSMIAGEKKLKKMWKTKLSARQRERVARQIAKTQKAFKSRRRSAVLLTEKIATEIKRLRIEKKLRVETALLEKRAREKEAHARRELKQQEDEAARVALTLQKQAEKRKKQALEVKRRAEATARAALAKKLRDEHVAKINQARLAYEKALARKEVAKEEMEAVELKKRTLRETEKGDDTESSKNNIEKLHREAAKAEEKVEETKRVSGEKIAEKRAEIASDKKQREKAQAKLQNEVLALKKEDAVVDRQDAVLDARKKNIV